MTVEIEINFSSNDFEHVLKWYLVAYRDKQPNVQDMKLYNKFCVLMESMKEDEEYEKSLTE